MKDDGTTSFELDPDDPVALNDRQAARLDGMSEEEVYAAALSDPDAQPLTREALSAMRRSVDPAAVRAKLNLTQQEFADTFHLSLSVVRNWEEGRSLPDQVARILLKVIGHDPEAVKRALNSA